MQSRILALGLGVVLLVTTGLVQAAPWGSGHDVRQRDTRHHADSRQGRVLESKPIYSLVTTPVREQRCYDVSPNRYGHGHGHGKQRCEMVTTHKKERKITGYRVKYEYRGRIYWTETRYQPGRFIEHRR